MMSSLIPYVLLALGLAASLGLFLTLKLEIHTSARKQRKRFEEISARLGEAWERATDAPLAIEVAAPSGLRSGLNLNRRVQAMRMARRGEQVSRIAAVLGVPRQEIELLIRVQNAVQARTVKAAF